jgi:hypothetical protein
MKRAAKKTADAGKPVVVAEVPPVPQDVIVQTVPLMEKLYLTLMEASQLSGLSQHFLQARIDSGDLKIINDTGIKIRRTDLKKL